MNEPRHGNPEPWHQPQPYRPYPGEGTQPIPPAFPAALRAARQRPHQQLRPAVSAGGGTTEATEPHAAPDPHPADVWPLVLGVDRAGTSTAEDNSSRVIASDPTQAPVDEPVATTAAVSKDDYQITVKTLSKECFGSAGCNVEARLTVAGDPVTDGVPVGLTISVTGDEDGPQVQTIDLDDQGSYSAPEVVLSTRSSKTKVKATITDLEVMN